jgi:hypothetical protein
MLSFNVTSDIQGGDQVQLMNTTLFVPNCGDGEEYASENSGCLK